MTCSDIVDQEIPDDGDSRFSVVLYQNGTKKWQDFHEECQQKRRN